MTERFTTEDLQGLYEYLSAPLVAAGFDVVKHDRKSGVQVSLYHKRRLFASVYLYRTKSVVVEVYGPDPFYECVNNTNYLRIQSVAQQIIDRKEKEGPDGV